MTRNEIDILWMRAMKQAIESGEMFTRYAFSNLVSAVEREACAQLCDDMQQHCSTLAARSMLMEAATAIRARSGA